MSMWKECKLVTLGKIITGKTPSRDNPEDWGDNTLFITPSDFGNYNKYANSSIRKLSPIGTVRQKARLLPAKSILVTCIGSDMGKVVINSSPCVTNQQINSIVPYIDVVDANFLYYENRFLYNVLRSMGSDGTAVPILNKSDFEQIDILLPTLPEQRAIVAILSSLDDKIDLLHRQNKTLETMAEILFTQWFINETDKCGKEGKLNDIVEIQSGFAFKSETFTETGPYKLVTIKAVQDGNLDLNNADSITYIPPKMPMCCYLVYKDILLSLTGNVGRCCIVDKPNLLLNQRVAKIHPILEKDRAFSYFYFRLSNTRRQLEEMAKGTAQANLSPIETGNLPIMIPSRLVLDKFSDIATPLFDKLVQNKNMISTLKSLRDTLLPKLMSGEVRVDV